MTSLISTPVYLPKPTSSLHGTMQTVVPIRSVSPPLIREMTLKFFIGPNHHIVHTLTPHFPLPLLPPIMHLPQLPLLPLGLLLLHLPILFGLVDHLHHSLCCGICGSPWVSSPGCYRGQLSSLQPRAKQAYRLAEGEDCSDGLYLTGQLMATFVETLLRFST